MQVFDCFMYFNEDIILELRLNYLDKFVDYFVIVESTFNHRGQKKNLNFDINKFLKFEKKIKYFVLDKQPTNLEKVNDNDNEAIKSGKYILNGYKRDHFQRNYISKGIVDANQEDIIIISDIDEIPKFRKTRF